MPSRRSRDLAQRLEVRRLAVCRGIENPRAAYTSAACRDSLTTRSPTPVVQLDLVGRRLLVEQAHGRGEKDAAEHDRDEPRCDPGYAPDVKAPARDGPARRRTCRRSRPGHRI
jgi:hypothetical protein